MESSKLNDEEKKLYEIRHSMSHILAKAVKELYKDKNVKLAIGPAIDNGFYYDFDINLTLNENHFAEIENKMKQIIKRNEDFKKVIISKKDALKLFADEPYKQELINELNDKEISVYYTGDDFYDLCKGPHIDNSKKLQSFAFKITKVSGAYWRGDEKNKMLQRVYVYGFKTAEELKKYIKMQEEALLRDHRILGQKLELFFISEYSQGIPFYMPNGLALKNELINLWRELHNKDGYIEIETPTIFNRKLWEISGHWSHYKENMYTLSIDNEEYAIKPMNCMGALLYYKQNLHSYKEFPLKIAELGKVFRYELSGALHGLSRVRSFTQDDAHILLLPNQIESEVANILNLIDKIYSILGLSAHHLELSTMPANHIGDEKEWRIAENSLENVLKKLGKKYSINAGDGAFYGPKIDIHISDAIGRTWQCGTIQLDMQMPKRFEIEYVDADGQKREPIMLHRVVFGSIDRFLGILIENFAGAFPLWLSPVQVKVLCVSDSSATYAQQIFEHLSSYLICSIIVFLLVVSGLLTSFCLRYSGSTCTVGGSISFSRNKEDCPIIELALFIIFPFPNKSQSVSTYVKRCIIFVNTSRLALFRPEIM